MSPMLKPDTSLAEDFSKPIEPGTYPAKVISAEGGVSKAGNQKIIVKFEIDVQGKKRTRSAHLAITGEGASGFDQLLRACYMDQLAEQYKRSEGPDFDPDSLREQELLVVVEENLYKPDVGPEQRRDQIRSFLKA